MKRLGLSLYPDISNNLQQDKAYLKMAAQYGFTRLFVCLLNTKRPKEEVITSFKEINGYAKTLGYQIIFDVSPQKFNELGIHYDDLSFFEHIYADGIRLDESFGGEKEAKMTYNPYHLNIELNASVKDGLVDRILCFQPNIDHLWTCHNYYPLRYSGLGLTAFMETSEMIKAHQLKTAAFVTSQNQHTFGPWSHNEGLCTLEMHRDLPLELQIRHLSALNVVDDILIGNAYASEEELRLAQKAIQTPFCFHLQSCHLSDIESKILFEFNHVIRGDLSDYMARSTMPRIVFQDASLPPHDTYPVVERGDVIIMNDQIMRYKGEVHLVLQTMKNDGRMNVVGRIPKQEHILLDELQAWNQFALIREE